MKKNMLAVIAAVTILSACGCRKHSDDTPAPKTCRLTKYRLSTPTFTGAYTLTYDGEGRVQTGTADFGGIVGKKEFSYRPGTIIAAITAGASPNGHDSAACNSNGLATCIATFSNSGTLIARTTYTYDGSGQLQSSVHFRPGYLTTSDTYTWAGGNVSRDNNTTYTYYADEPARAGCYFEIEDLGLFGGAAHTIRNTALLKSITTGSSTENVAYTFDSEDRISTAVFTKGGAVTRTYDNMEYECK